VSNKEKTILIIGATGYIGGAVVQQAVKDGYRVIAVTRSAKEDTRFLGAEAVVADVADPASMEQLFNHHKIDAVISCLACRSGLTEDFFAIDYHATLNVLNVGKQHGISKFILLSAICTRKPELPLQQAKLLMEDELIRSGVDYSIIRPTAYFWVFDVQTPMIEKGRPGYVVGSGDQAVHNPISKEDLAEFMVDCISDPERRNRIFVLGGPEVDGNVVTYKESLEMIFKQMGKEPKISRIPRWVAMGLIRFSGFLGLFFRKPGIFSLFLKNTLYYLENDMRAPGYGTMTLQQHIENKDREIETTQTLRTIKE